ncbi:MAG: hypothetical protein JJ979_04570 [Roseibium sp.]|nr:hypothetical protein [Roseibium sp.]
MADRSEKPADAMLCVLGFIIGATAASSFVEERIGGAASPDKIDWLFDNSKSISRHIPAGPAAKDCEVERQK